MEWIISYSLSRNKILKFSINVNDSFHFNKTTKHNFFYSIKISHFIFTLVPVIQTKHTWPLELFLPLIIHKLITFYVIIYSFCQQKFRSINPRKRVLVLPPFVTFIFFFIYFDSLSQWNLIYACAIHFVRRGCGACTTLKRIILFIITSTLSIFVQRA